MEEDTIYNHVNEVLTEMPEARDNDKILIFEVLRRLGFHIEVKEPIDSMPSFESIRRVRQQIQSPKGENRLLPSIPVKERRELMNEEFHSKYSKKDMASTAPNSYMMQEE